MGDGCQKGVITPTALPMILLTGLVKRFQRIEMHR
jgi:hypothetical protein